MTSHPKSRISEPGAGQPLDPDGAFVVQFRAGPLVSPDAHPGRIEHVSSGETLQFNSTQELLGFVRRMLASVRDRD